VSALDERHQLRPAGLVWPHDIDIAKFEQFSLSRYLIGRLSIFHIVRIPHFGYNISVGGWRSKKTATG